MDFDDFFSLCLEIQKEAGGGIRSAVQCAGKPEIIPLKNLMFYRNQGLELKYVILREKNTSKYV